MITVANIRTTKAGEYVGRPAPRRRLRGSALGNPFPLPQFSRAESMERYQDWFDRQMQSDTPARREIERLTELARAGDLVLLCWCKDDAHPDAPQPACHADVIKEFIERRLEGR